MGSSRTVDLDPQKLGNLPVIGAVDADFRTTTQFAKELDIAGSGAGIVARLTCYDDQLVLKSYDLLGTGNPTFSAVLPKQLQLDFDANSADDPDFGYPTINLSDPGQLASLDDSKVGPGVYGIIDIDA